MSILSIPIPCSLLVTSVLCVSYESMVTLFSLAKSTSAFQYTTETFRERDKGILFASKGEVLTGVVDVMKGIAPANIL